MNELGRDKLPSTQPSPWAAKEKTPALASASQPAGGDAQTEPQGERQAPKLVLD